MVSVMLKVGKLDSELLKEIVFDKITFRRDEILTRPGIGEDCAVMDCGDYECVLSTDPVTASIEDIGRLAVHVSCNDIASNGVEPAGLLLAVLLPEGTTEDEISAMMEQAGKAGEELGVEIIGGHTEITRAVRQPVITSTAVGRALKGTSQKAEDMRPGDVLMVTKSIGLEGTGILATEKDLSSVLTDDEIKTAKGMLEKVSVVKEGVIAGRTGTHGMHDVTEGGILGAVWEVCCISGLGAVINRNSIPVSEITEKLCGALGIDCLRLISSGCMLIICDPDKADEMEEGLRSAGIEVSRIGTAGEAGAPVMFDDGEIIDPPGPDEIYAALAKEL